MKIELTVFCNEDLESQCRTILRMIIQGYDYKKIKEIMANKK